MPTPHKHAALIKHGHSGMTADPRDVAFTVKQQGAVVVNTAWVHFECDQLIAIEVDLHSKYCDLGASCGHGVMLGTTERSLHLDPTKDRDSYTWIEFSLPPGKWDFYTGSVSRYTLRAVFTKEA